MPQLVGGELRASTFLLVPEGWSELLLSGNLSAADGLGDLGHPTGTFTSGLLTPQTVYGPGTDNPLSQTASGQTCFLHADGSGSVTSVTNVSQGLQSSYRCDPYGKSVQAAGLVSSPHRYAGGVWDAGPGLACDRARECDPSREGCCRTARTAAGTPEPGTAW